MEKRAFPFKRRGVQEVLGSSKASMSACSCDIASMDAVQHLAFERYGAKAVT